MGYLFALLSPAIDAGVNFIDKFLLEKYEISSKVIAVYSGLFAFIGSLLVLFAVGFQRFDLVTSAILITSGFLTIILLLPYIEALTIDEASRVGPLFQFVPVFVIILSAFFLQERLSTMQYMGAGIIVTSGFLLSIDRTIEGVFTIRKAFWYMLLASLLSATTVVLFKFGVSETGFWPAIPYEGFGHGLGVVAIYFFGNNSVGIRKVTKRLPMKAFVIMAVVEVLYIMSRYAGFFALSLLSAGIVSVLYGFQPLFIVLLGIVLSVWYPKIFKEVISKEALVVKLLSVIGMVIGLMLIFI